jgi:hypothetical protein
MSEILIEKEIERLLFLWKDICSKFNVELKSYSQEAVEDETEANGVSEKDA